MNKMQNNLQKNGQLTLNIKMMPFETLEAKICTPHTTWFSFIDIKEALNKNEHWHAYYRWLKHNKKTRKNL